MPYELPELKYGYDALEPHFDSKTMKMHYLGHHAQYLKKFNKLIDEYVLGEFGTREIFAHVSDFPEALRNNGGGFFNHSIFWNVVTPGSNKLENIALSDAINKFFGTKRSLKKEFAERALSHFGSGWAWLIKKGNGELVVYSSPNNDNALMDISPIRGEPLLCLDLWEHAYYLKYGNNREAYIEAFWNLVNWKYVAELYNEQNNF